MLRVTVGCAGLAAACLVGIGAAGTGFGSAAFVPWPLPQAGERSRKSPNRQNPCFARLPKNPPEDADDELAVATRAGAATGAGFETGTAATSAGACSGVRGGLTVPGFAPGADWNAAIE